jgi:hypothetical protein
MKKKLSVPLRFPLRPTLREGEAPTAFKNATNLCEAILTILKCFIKTDMLSNKVFLIVS